MKQYQFKLSADFKRIIVRELPDFKERYLRDPKLDGPTGEKYALRFSKEIVVSHADESKHRKWLLDLIDARLQDARTKLARTKATEKRKQMTFDIERLQQMQIQLLQAPVIVGPDNPKVHAAIHRAKGMRNETLLSCQHTTRAREGGKRHPYDGQRLAASPSMRRDSS